jgi:hypothetical protein
VPLEGEEVAQRPRAQRREQPRAGDALAGAGGIRFRRSGLDERDHVAVEPGVDDPLAAEYAHPGAAAGVVGRDLHARSSRIAAPAHRTASLIFT